MVEKKAKKKSVNIRRRLPESRPAILQAAVQHGDYQEIKRRCRDAYPSSDEITKLLIEELAGHIWEIRELGRVKHGLVRMKIAEVFSDPNGATQSDQIGADFIGEDTISSRLVDRAVMRTGAPMSVVAFRAMRHIQADLDLLDKLISFAEKRRDNLFKELDRRAMARIIMQERS